MKYEDDIQMRVVALWEAYQLPDTALIHIPNGEKRSKRTAGKLKRMGVRKGAPDFLCLGDTAFFIEMKREGGRLSKDQKDVIRLAAMRNLPTLVAYSVADAVLILQQRGLLRADIKFTVSGDPSGIVGARDGSEVSASDPSIKFTKEAVTAD